MSQTQEFQDCDSIIGLRGSLVAEINNFYTSISGIVALMTIINADVPRRAKFDTMYRKIDDEYDKNVFDDCVTKLEALKVHLEDEGWIPE